MSSKGIAAMLLVAMIVLIGLIAAPASLAQKTLRFHVVKHAKHFDVVEGHHHRFKVGHRARRVTVRNDMAFRVVKRTRSNVYLAAAPKGATTRLTILSPNGGDLTVGTSTTVRWRTSSPVYFGHYRISLYDRMTGAPVDSMPWTVPARLFATRYSAPWVVDQAAGSYTLTVSHCSADGTVLSSDASDGAVNIVNATDPAPTPTEAPTPAPTPSVTPTPTPTPSVTPTPTPTPSVTPTPTPAVSALPLPIPSPTATVTPAADQVVSTVAGAKPGTLVVLPAGTFAISSSLTIPSGVWLQGAGMDATWLKGKVFYGSRIVARDLKVGDLGYSTRNAAGASTTLFERVQFRGGGGTGSNAPVIIFGDGTASCDNIYLKDCKVERNLGTETSTFSRDFNNIRITENNAPGGAHVDSITFDGCHIGVSNGVATGCPRMDLEAYTWDGGTGNYTRGWSNLVVKGCTFETSDWYNIDLADHASTVDGSRVSGPALIQGNVLKGGKGRYTICVESPKGVVIEDNLIYRGGANTFKMGCGDMSTVNPQTVVRNNTFDLTVDNGSSIGSPWFLLKGGGNQFTGNTVRAPAGANGDVVAFHQARSNTVTGNTLWIPTTARLFADYGDSSDNVTSPNRLN